MKNTSSKNTAWKYFAHYIRRKECIETTGDPDAGICCTCGQYKHFSQMDAGHFVSGRTDNILFDEDLVHIQCSQCNRFGSGMWPEYYEYMVKRYGEEKTTELRKRKFEYKPLTKEKVLEIREEYKGKLKKLGFWPI